MSKDIAGSELDKLIQAFEDEYFEHDSCRYEIDCILTSDTLKERLKQVLAAHDAEKKQQAIHQFADGLVDKARWIQDYHAYAIERSYKAVPVSTIEAAAKAVQEGGR